MKLDVITILALSSLAACAADPGTEIEEEETEEEPEQPEQPEQPILPTPLCVSGGMYDFQISSTGLAQFEGKRVAVAAIERDFETQTAAHRALVHGTVSAGAFSLGCSDALTENYSYPVWAVYIDTDDSGDCSDADRGAYSLLFGWDSDIVEQLSTEAWVPVSEHTGINGEQGFCGYFTREAP
jgi:hypothetical protein